MPVKEFIKNHREQINDFEGDSKGLYYWLLRSLGISEDYFKDQSTYGVVITARITNVAMPILATIMMAAAKQYGASIYVEVSPDLGYTEDVFINDDGELYQIMRNNEPFTSWLTLPREVTKYVMGHFMTSWKK